MNIIDDLAFGYIESWGKQQCDLCLKDLTNSLCKYMCKTCVWKVWYCCNCMDLHEKINTLGHEIQQWDSVEDCFVSVHSHARESLRLRKFCNNETPCSSKRIAHTSRKDSEQTGLHELRVIGLEGSGIQNFNFNETNNFMRTLARHRLFPATQYEHKQYLLLALWTY